MTSWFSAASLLALEMLRELLRVLPELALVLLVPELKLLLLVVPSLLEDSVLLVEVEELEKLGILPPKSFSLITSLPVISFRILICSLKSSCTHAKLRMMPRIV